MALDEKVTAKLAEAAKKYVTAITIRADYREIQTGLSDLSDLFSKKAEDLKLDAKKSPEGQTASLADLLLENLRVGEDERGDNFAFFLFNDILKVLRSYNGSISTTYAKDKIRKLFAMLHHYETKKSDMGFKGAVTYVKNGRMEYGLVYYRL